MTAVTVLGLGPMGQALAGAFLKGGHDTTIWNRSAGKGDELVAQGAKLADSAAAAVAASDVVVVCVIDYKAVGAILQPVADGLKGKTLVNLTADSPESAREFAKWAASAGADYLDGAILTPAPTVGGPAAVVLYAGPQSFYAKYEETFKAIGGTSAYLGEDPGRAAAHDVSLLDMFWTGMAGLVHGFALAKAEGINAADLAGFAQGIIGLLPNIAADFAKRIDEGNFSEDISSIASAAAGMDHIIHVAQDRGIDTGVLDAAAKIAHKAVQNGDGDGSYALLTNVLHEG